MSSAQIMILLEHLLNKSITLTKFSWSNTDKNLHVHFFDAGGNTFHRTFNLLGHFLEWED